MHMSVSDIPIIVKSQKMLLTYIIYIFERGKHTKSSAIPSRNSVSPFPVEIHCVVFVSQRIEGEKLV